jgi:hypothetical protein
MFAERAEIQSFDDECLVLKWRVLRSPEIQNF